MDWEEISDLLGLEMAGDNLRKMAYGYREYDNYIKGTDSVGTRILSLSDLHIPFHLPVETWKPYVGRVDILVLNGDIEDAQSVSKFSKQYRIPFVEEMIQTRQFIIDLVNMLRPKTVYIVKGNHETRMTKYLSDQLNEDILNLMPDTPMDLIVNDGFKNRDRRNRAETWYSPLRDDFSGEGIDVIYNGSWWVKVGKTIFVHPLAYSQGMLKTTEKALEYFLRQDRDFSTLVMAHTHRLGSYTQGKIQLYEQGCCCNTDLLNYNDGYMTLPAQRGFLYLCQTPDGEEIRSKTRLVAL